MNTPYNPSHIAVMADMNGEQDLESQQADNEVPSENVFIPPSVDKVPVLGGITYSHFTHIPEILQQDMNIECVMGVDEAGRGPVLGPMVYGVFYLPRDLETPLLADTHSFNDSKVLTPNVRSSLMQTLCTTTSDLHSQCGWATRLISACDIGAGMLQPAGAYNLNAQAMDATVSLIREVLQRGINVRELYVDTIGQPESYQRRLEKIFPTLRITVAKKADSLFPCVSAASVVAKVTRDAALETCAEHLARTGSSVEGEGTDQSIAATWGSGYPSDARCINWMKQNMDHIFGWGSECRFSWGTAKEMLEGKANSLKVDWPAEDEDGDMKMTNFFLSKGEEGRDELTAWYGNRAGEEIF